MATDLPESQKLSDEDVLVVSSGVPTFLVAGHETTSAAITWALAPNILTMLREELLSVDTNTPPKDELMAFPYLDAVVRETPCPSTRSKFTPGRNERRCHPVGKSVHRQGRDTAA
ncbi:hypothetical protein BJ138DRAFT_1107732 [Hygrophoropsis aurantiaca]|uniref:Uncharacterized protein n=1 Tax=Hygrophoropsis aurantiaca TaxID=72124 RepID=A0ACB7ZRD1_9AGAM|nr:hypothetical protein BJ138DRAFT_1107732 [Hygrophoropsis aurantiaca]